MYKKAFLSITVLIAGFFLFASGCRGKPEQTKELFLAEGLKLMKAGNTQGAIVVFRNALEFDQNFFEARLQLAKACAVSGNVDAAEKELQKIIRQCPSLKEAHRELARVYIKKSKPDDALREIAPFIAASPADADALTMAGLAWSIKGEYVKASDLLQKALQADDSKAEAAVALANVCLKRNRSGEAKTHIAGVLKKEPNNIDALYLLATVQVKEQKTPEALATYDHLITAHPSAVEAYLKKGMLYLDIKEYDKALPLAEHMISRFPKRSEGYVIKGIALYYKKDLGDALIALQQSVSIMPSTAGYYYLGLSHYYRGDYEQALNQLQRSLDLNPLQIQPRLLLSFVLLHMKRTDDAITEAKKVLEEQDENALAHDILGSAYMIKGDGEAAIKEIDKALLLDPKLADAHIKKGMLDMGKGNAKEAEAELLSAVRAAPDVLDTRFALVSYYMRQKEYGKALKALKEGLRNIKQDAVIYNYMAKVRASRDKYIEEAFFQGVLYEQAGNKREAVREYQKILSKAGNYIPALNNLAYLYAEGYGKREDALTLAERAYVQAPSSPEVMDTLGYTLLKNGKVDQAEKLLEKAILLQPENPLIRYHVAQARLLLATLKKSNNLREKNGIQSAEPDKKSTDTRHGTAR